MKVTPILFSSDMVRALLSGRKTQTRRVVKGLGKDYPLVNLARFEPDEYSGEYNDPESWGWPFAEDGEHMPLAWWLNVCPYGNAGDLLWVRETHSIGRDLRGNPITATFLAEDQPGTLIGGKHRYNPDRPEGSESWCLQWIKRPSIHMPKWASRLTLKITNLRVDRLQDISEQDAKAEGIDSDILPACGDHPELMCFVSIPDDNHAYSTRVEAFKKTWQNIYGKPSWDANPWVWVIEFEVIKQNVIQYMEAHDD